MSNALVGMMGAAGDLLDGKRSKIVRKVARGAMKGGRTFRRALSMLRGIHLGDVLVWLRLSRRRGPLGTIALLGGGAVVGAGLVMLLSPRSGTDVRRTLRSRTAGLTNQARQALRGARSGVEHLEQQAKGAVKDVERRVEDTVSEALRTAREAARAKPD